MARIKKIRKPDIGVPSSSLADMAFILLIFFVVSTTFVRERGLNVFLPRAESIDKIPRANAVTIYIDQSGNISIDDFIVEIPMIENIMRRKLYENFNMITAFRTDENTQYGVMQDVMNQMRRAEALRVSFETRRRVR